MNKHPIKTEETITLVAKRTTWLTMGADFTVYITLISNLSLTYSLMK